METALGPVTPELVLVDSGLAALVRAGGPRTDCLAPRTREPEIPEPRRAAAGRCRPRLFTVLLVVSLLANAALIGEASTRKPRAPITAAMIPAPTLDAASPAQGIGLPASSDSAPCSDAVLRGPATSSGVGPAPPSSTAAPSSPAARAAPAGPGTSIDTASPGATITVQSAGRSSRSPRCK